MGIADVEMGMSQTRVPEVVARQESADCNTDPQQSSVRVSLKRLWSLGSDDEEHVKRDMSKAWSLRRMNTFTLSEISAAEATELMQMTVYKSLYEEIRPYLPFLLWYDL
jgi:hypothetical protein